MKNQDIRKVAKNENVKLWEIANKLEITDSNFSRKLRQELCDEEKEKIYHIIKSLAEERNGRE